MAKRLVKKETNKKIIVKEIDRFESKISKGKTISEYLIYLMMDGIVIEAYTEIGTKNRDKIINRLQPNYSSQDIETNPILEPNDMVEAVVEEITFEEFLKNNK